MLMVIKDRRHHCLLAFDKLLTIRGFMLVFNAILDLMIEQQQRRPINHKKKQKFDLSIKNTIKEQITDKMW